jgi:hypothetical protein
MHLLDMQRENLDGQNLCSQIYGRDWILEPPCHSTFKRRGGSGIGRASLEWPGLGCPDQWCSRRFWTPLAILPLIKGGGGGVRNGGVLTKGPIPVVSPFVSPPHLLLHLTMRQGSIPLAPPRPPTSVHLPILKLRSGVNLLTSHVD